MESEEQQNFYFIADKRSQHLIPDSVRMAMQAAVDMGLSEHQTGKLFNVPSATRVLKELRSV